MKSVLKSTIAFYISFTLLFIQLNNKVFASHAQGTDITYKCLGGNQYQVNLSFYRDCAGSSAPNTATVNISSISCGQNFDITLNRVAGTGIDVTPICPTLTTQCNGGAYPGVQEYLYTAVVTLPTKCKDWVFGFTLCCRNAAITTISNPSAQNIYVESTLNNLDFSCNNSPSFLNKPVPFVCVGQPYCYNNGANEIDGDSLYYRLLPPKTGPSTTVTYNAGYSPAQPLSSVPAVTFDNSKGDMCMFPNMLQITVFSVLVEEWRNGIMVGSVIRDIQLKTIACTNTNPYVNGVNNTGQYTLTACAGVPINFTIPTFDSDAGQNVTLSWDNGIPSGTFVSSGGSRPTGTFSWTPTTAQISNNPYCFTVTVKDNNCPYYGSQVFSFCISVTGFSISTTTTNANCGIADGTAVVQTTGNAGSYTYSWAPSGGTSSSATGLAPGTYTVTITSDAGCTHTETATIGNNGGALNATLASSAVLCFGTNTGAITATATGAQSPYTYSWSNGPTTATNSGLAVGTYSVIVTSSNGCSTTVAATIGQPTAALSYTTAQTNVSCYGLSNANATITVAGGTTPYAYLWNTTPVKTTATAANLAAGNYSVIVTDARGCSITASFVITQPNVLTVNSAVINNATCFGLANGTATNTVVGGTTPYNYQWNTNPIQTTATASGVAFGNYIITITDANSCTATSSVTITQPTELIIATSGTSITCNAAANGQADVVSNGGTPNYTYQWLPAGGANATASGLSPNTYTVIVNDNNSCSKTGTVIINEPTALAYTTTQTNVTCFGAANGSATVTVTGGTTPYTYLWPSCGCSTPTTSGLTAGNYSVIITDAKGCSKTANFVITQPNSLTVISSVMNHATCFGLANGTATSTVTGGTTPYTYLWNATPLQTAATATGLAPGNYIISITDANSCTATSSVTITEPTELAIATSGISVTCNAAANAKATVVANGGTPNYTYEWLPAGGMNPIASGLSPNTYTVIVNDNNGCSKTGTVIINEPTALTATTTQTNITCFGAANGNSTIAVTGGTTPYTYLWNSSPAQLSAAAINLVPGNYSVLVTDGNGCTLSSTVTISEPTPLSTNALVVSNITCYGLTNGIATAGTSGGTAPYTYQWDTSPIQTTQTANELALGNYTVLVTDANNCTSTSNLAITEPSLLTISASGTNITCYAAANGQATVVANGGIPNYTYQWYPTGGTNATNLGLSPGTYTVIVSDVNSCSQSATISIVQPAPIIITATGNATICLGQNTTISASATGGSGSYTYTWTGNGTLTGATQTVSPNVPTTYLVNVTDSAGCSGIAASVIIINVTSLTAANLTVSPGDRICAGTNTTIFSTVTGNTGPVTIDWSSNLGVGNGPFTVSPTTTTTYTVTVKDVCNNSVFATVPVIVNPLPEVNISPLSAVACEEAPLTFVNNSTSAGSAQHYWSFGDGASSSETNPTHTYTNSGVYTINLNVTSTEGCSDSSGTTATVTVYPASIAKFESEALDGTTIRPIYRFRNTSSNAISSLWDFGDGTVSSSPNVYDTKHEYKEQGEYLVSLTTTSVDGCPGYSDMRVVVTPEFVIYIPNAFTPDGDGVNDLFIPKGMEISDFKMEIYSRWGEMIYRTEDIHFGWDGKANYGTHVAQGGVYVYKINVKDMNDKPHDFTGHVTLIKNEAEEY